jgi:hypothetical protein
MCHVSTRRLSICNFEWGLKATSIFNTPKAKKTKKHIGSIRKKCEGAKNSYEGYPTELQAQP